MTLNEAIKQNKLPRLSEDYYKSILDSLSIKINDFDKDELTEENLMRLVSDFRIHAALTRRNFSEDNSKLTKNYEQVLEEIDALSKDLDDSALREAKEFADKLKSEMDNRKTSYENDKKDFSIARENLGINDIELSDFDRDKLETQNNKMIKNTKKLNEEYQKLESLQNKEFHTAYKQAQNQRRIDKVIKRIEKLQTKQGILQSKQQRIINKATDKYVNIKEKEFRKYREQMDRMNTYLEEKNTTKKAIEDYQKDLALTNQELNEASLSDKKISAFEKFKLRHEKNVLERSISKLEKQDKKIESTFKRYQNREALMNALKNGTIISEIGKQYHRNPHLAHGM